MRSEVHDHPESYRTASRPDAMPVTVTTVSRNEYAEPAWIARLKDALRRLLPCAAPACPEPQPNR